MAERCPDLRRTALGEDSGDRTHRQPVEGEARRRGGMKRRPAPRAVLFFFFRWGDRVGCGGGFDIEIGRSRMPDGSPNRSTRGRELQRDRGFGPHHLSRHAEAAVFRLARRPERMRGRCMRAGPRGRTRCHRHARCALDADDASRSLRTALPRLREMDAAVRARHPCVALSRARRDRASTRRRMSRTAFAPKRGRRSAPPPPQPPHSPSPTAPDPPPRPPPPAPPTPPTPWDPPRRGQRAPPRRRGARMIAIAGRTQSRESPIPVVSIQARVHRDAQRGLRHESNAGDVLSARNKAVMERAAGGPRASCAWRDAKGRRRPIRSGSRGAGDAATSRSARVSDLRAGGGGPVKACADAALPSEVVTRPPAAVSWLVAKPGSR